MTELWSDNDEKTQLPGGVDGDHNQTTAHRGGVVSQYTHKTTLPTSIAAV